MRIEMEELVQFFQFKDTSLFTADQLIDTSIILYHKIKWNAMRKWEKLYEKDNHVLVVGEPCMVSEDINDNMNSSSECIVQRNEEKEENKKIQPAPAEPASAEIRKPKPVRPPRVCTPPPPATVGPPPIPKPRRVNGV